MGTSCVCVWHFNRFPDLNTVTSAFPVSRGELAFGEFCFDGCDELRRIRSGVGRKAFDHLAGAADKKLLEVPENLGFSIGLDTVTVQLLGKWNFAQTHCLGLRCDQRRIERVLIWPYHIDLAKHGKLHAKVGCAEGLNLLFCPRLLALEVVGREAG